MRSRLRLLSGISILWLALSLAFDGLNTLVLPVRLETLDASGSKATVLGLITFVGLLLGMLMQPIAGMLSDRLRPRWGRRGMIAGAVLGFLAALVVFGLAPNLASVIV